MRKIYPSERLTNINVNGHTSSVEPFSNGWKPFVCVQLRKANLAIQAIVFLLVIESWSSKSPAYNQLGGLT